MQASSAPLRLEDAADLLSQKEAAGYLGLKSDRTVRNWTRDGRLHAVHIGSRIVRYRRDEIARFLNDCEAL